ncbi:amidase [Mesorhizobium sp. 128a]
MSSQTAACIPELCRPEAVELARLIRARNISAVEVITAYLDHIEQVNPLVNAIISLRPRRDLLEEAAAADVAVSRGERVGPLHGVPQAIKDLANTKGLLTTYGSPLFRDFIPDNDAIFVSRMRAAGAIIIGKTNTPEFGLGSNSYNPIFGTTLNAYDQTRIGGGSSGGAAVSIAMRMLPVADGSDMGGSLRNPAAFNNVIGFRTSAGRVPRLAIDAFSSQMTVDGPMGRTVEDVAMLLSVQAGYDDRVPQSLDSAPRWLDKLKPIHPRKARFGWLGDWTSQLAFEPGLVDLVRGAAGKFAQAGAVVEDISSGFDLERLWTTYVTLRSTALAGQLNDAYDDPSRRDLIKPEAQWEVEQSRTLSTHDLYAAQLARTEWYLRMVSLFERYDYLLLPSAQVFPFDASSHWPKKINGRTMDTYHRWMQVVIGPTLASLPSIGIPAGFDPRGLPMGMQIIGRPRGDRSVLEAALFYEQLNPWNKHHPPCLRL